jgi:hypothetical protein
MLSESNVPFAMPESLQRDPVVRVQMFGLSGVMVTKHQASIIMQQVEYEEDNGLIACVITDRLAVRFSVSAITLQIAVIV